MQKLKKAAGTALIYIGLFGCGIMSCFADGVQNFGKFFAVLAVFCVSMLAGVALRGAE